MRHARISRGLAPGAIALAFLRTRRVAIALRGGKQEPPIALT